MRLLSSSLRPTFFSPRINPNQLRRLLRLGITLRWVAIGCAGLAGVLVAKPPVLLFFLMLGAMVYNLGLMAAIRQVSDAGAARLALLACVLDPLFQLGFIAIYTPTTPNADQVAPYMPALIEAVAYFGTAGAVLSTGIYVVAMALFDLTLRYSGHSAAPAIWVIEAVIVVALMGAVLAGVVRILTSPQEVAELASGLRLSQREQEVLRLVSEGYSNSMIASRLHLSDNTVKGYVENLLTHLNARNRAEAVAAASRMKLL